jgi:hypothetical protein
MIDKKEIRISKGEFSLWPHSFSGADCMACRLLNHGQAPFRKMLI